jgi:hypothetical protein
LEKQDAFLIPRQEKFNEKFKEKFKEKFNCFSYCPIIEAPIAICCTPSARRWASSSACCWWSRGSLFTLAIATGRATACRTEAGTVHQAGFPLTRLTPPYRPPRAFCLACRSRGLALDPGLELAQQRQPGEIHFLRPLEGALLALAGAAAASRGGTPI